jgi:hypothetical protein
MHALKDCYQKSTPKKSFFVAAAVPHCLQHLFSIYFALILKLDWQNPALIQQPPTREHKTLAFMLFNG